MNTKTTQSTKEDAFLKERFIATIVLAGVGDAIGFNDGSWEFCRDGERIHKELKEMGGLSKINVNGWPVSDDTIMHIATCEALVQKISSMDELMTQMAKEYIKCWSRMSGRAPGGTCGGGVMFLRNNKWNTTPYNRFGGGCGGSMGIGLRFFGQKNRENLVGVGIESGRLTHNHPTGSLGAMVSAAFTALAIEGVPPKKWGKILMDELLPLSKTYFEKTGRDVDENLSDMGSFITKWKYYLKDRGIEDGVSDPKFPKDWHTNISGRDEYYTKYSYNGWAGASGDDSVIIAYDALLAAGNDWEKLNLYGTFHGGDSDSTGTIACAWFGALYGFKGVYKSNYEKLEFLDSLTDLGTKLYNLSKKQISFKLYEDPKEKSEDSTEQVKKEEEIVE